MENTKNKNSSHSNKKSLGESKKEVFKVDDPHGIYKDGLTKDEYERSRKAIQRIQSRKKYKKIHPLISLLLFLGIKR